jgi:putative nucleotidyltransferase with HDIG domain
MNTVQQFHDLIVTCQPINLQDFKEVIGELLPLETCLQDPAWHGELDVLSHTNLVMKETLTQMENLRPGFPRIALYLAALLHDVGKPDTAKPKKNGHNSFHGHEKAGVWRAKEFLRKYFPEYNYRQRDLILNLVEFHGHPKRMTEGHSHDDKFKQLSLEVPTHLVYNLEVADFNGRIANDKEKTIIVLDNFKKRCEDLGVYGKAYQVPNVKHLTNLQYSILRWNILMHHKKEDDQREIDRIIKLTDKSPQEVTLLIGAPASGKSTYRNSLTNSTVICMDDIRKELCGNPNDQSKNQLVFDRCLKDLSKAIKAGENVVLDNTNFSRKMRKMFLEVARNHGCQINAVYWDLPIETLLKRNLEREKAVPEDVVWRFYKNLETPASYEYEQLHVFEE